VVLSGYLGEFALEDHSGIKFFGESIGSAIVYDIPYFNRSGIEGGVKAVGRGKFPIMRRKNDYPQIMCMADQEETIYICGLANVETLNSFRDLESVKDDNTKKRGLKTAFFGFICFVRFETSAGLNEKAALETGRGFRSISGPFAMR